MTSLCNEDSIKSIEIPQGKQKLVRKIGEFEKSEVKLQRLTQEVKLLLVRIIGRLEKLRVRDIGIPLYYFVPKRAGQQIMQSDWFLAWSGFSFL